LVALLNNQTGSDNTALGFGAGHNTTGSKNTFIGFEAGKDEAGSNKLYIANSDTTTPLIYGDFLAKKVTINDDLSVIGTLVANSFETADGTPIGGATNGKGWTGGTYSTTTGKVTFTSDDGLGFVTDDIRGEAGITPDVNDFVQKTGDTMSGALGIVGDLNLTGELNLAQSTTNYIDYNSGLEIRAANSHPAYEKSITMYNDGPVSLFFNNNERLMTTSPGVTVSGELKAQSVRFDSHHEILKSGSALVIKGSATEPSVIIKHGDTEVFTTESTGVKITGTIVATDGITAFSDERLKENISVLKNPLEALEEIRGVSYTRKDTNKKDIGVIAQDVEKVYPELIHETEDGIKTVNYNGLIGVLLQSVKDLSSQVKDLRRELEVIKGEK